MQSRSASANGEGRSVTARSASAFAWVTERKQSVMATLASFIILIGGSKGAFSERFWGFIVIASVVCVVCTSLGVTRQSVEGFVLLCVAALLLYGWGS
jgi:hypothetical protein